MSDELLRLAYEASLTAHEQDLRETILQHYKFATVMFGDLPREREQHLAIADAALNEFAASRGLKLVPLVDRVGGEGLLDRVLDELREEVGKARSKHAPMNSPHEGWAVIREELDPELWAHVCGNTGRSPEARGEALQVAAMGVRYILDLIDGPAALVNDETGEPR